MSTQPHRPFQLEHISFRNTIIAVWSAWLRSGHSSITCPSPCTLHSNPSITAITPPFAPHSQSYAPFRGHTFCSSIDSSQPELCSLPRTYLLFIHRILTARAMLPSEDIPSVHPPIPHSQSYAPFRGHTFCSSIDSSQPELCSQHDHGSHASVHLTSGTCFRSPPRLHLLAALHCNLFAQTPTFLSVNRHHMRLHAHGIH